MVSEDEAERIKVELGSKLSKSKIWKAAKAVVSRAQIVSFCMNVICGASLISRRFTNTKLVSNLCGVIPPSESLIVKANEVSVS